jgi:hypothetical protein
LPGVPMILIPVDNDPRRATTSRAKSLVSTKLRRMHNVILIAVVTLEVIRGTPCG